MSFPKHLELFLGGGEWVGGWGVMLATILVISVAFTATEILKWVILFSKIIFSQWNRWADFLNSMAMFI